MSTILYKSMCQVFLDHSIIPHFPALYFVHFPNYHLVPCRFLKHSDTEELFNISWNCWGEACGVYLLVR